MISIIDTTLALDLFKCLAVRLGLNEQNVYAAYEIKISTWSFEMVVIWHKW